jgi:hypothetical protein
VPLDDAVRAEVLDLRPQRTAQPREVRPRVAEPDGEDLAACGRDVFCGERRLPLPPPRDVWLLIERGAQRRADGRVVRIRLEHAHRGATA